jgi:hypothetical protein
MSETWRGNKKKKEEMTTITIIGWSEGNGERERNRKLDNKATHFIYLDY